MFPNGSAGSGPGGRFGRQMGMPSVDPFVNNGNSNPFIGSPALSSNPFDADPSGGFNALVQSRVGRGAVRGGRGAGRGGRFGSIDSTRIGNSTAMDTSGGGGRGRGGRIGNSMAMSTSGGRFGGAMLATRSAPLSSPVQSPFFIGNNTSLTDFSVMGDDSFNTLAMGGDHSRTTFARASAPGVRRAKGLFEPKSLPTCRVCSKQFESFDELKKHIRVENHHNDAAASATPGKGDAPIVMVPTASFPIASRVRERPLSPKGKQVQGMVVPGKDTALMDMKEKLRLSMLKQGAEHKAFATKCVDGRAANAALQISAVGAADDDGAQDMGDDEDNAVIFDDSDYKAADEDEQDSPLASNADEGGDADDADDEAVSVQSEASNGAKVIAQQATAIPKQPVAIQRINSLPSVHNGADGDDNGSSMIGTCEDMCPSDERESRIELQLLEPFEREHPAIRGTARDLMIKEFKRSSADYLLLIPHRIRTPPTLLKTIRYIEDNIMEKDKQGVDPRFGCNPPSITVYLFIWDRYRMVAKDFILQEFAIGVDEVYMECHERMARWFILMDHTMQKDDKFNDGHLQQNRESTNKLFKTLLECYKDSKLSHVSMPNKAEFISYYLLEQMGNGGEVAKLMRQLSFEVRSSEKLKFVAEVWAAWKMDDYSRFFRLLQKADACQASLMHRYVGDIRLAGIKKMVRSYFFKGSVSYYPMQDLINLFMFEDLDDALVFVRHCGIAVEEVLLSSDDTKETLCAIFVDQRIQDLLPRDKNGHPIRPKAMHMSQGIDSKYAHHSLGEVCRGALSAIRVFDDSKVVPTAQRYAPPSPRPAATKVPVKAVPDRPPTKPIAAMKQEAPKPSAAALAMLNSALGEGPAKKKFELKEPPKQQAAPDSTHALQPTLKEPAPPAHLVSAESTDSKVAGPFQFAANPQSKHVVENDHTTQSAAFGSSNLFSTAPPPLKETAEPLVQQPPPVDTAAQQAAIAAQQRKAEEEEQRRRRDEAAARQREQEMLREMQRLEADRLERLKEEQLVPLMQVTQKHLRRRTAAKFFAVWHKLALLRSSGHRKAVKHIFFRNWLRLLRKRQLRSRQIIFDLQCIDISRPDIAKSAHGADNNLATGRVEGRVAAVLPLQGCSPYAFTPSLAVATPLFRTQSGAVRRELGYLDTDILDASTKAGPLWQGDIFWKLALVSDAQIEGHYHSDDGMLASAVRATLTSQVASGGADGVIGLWRDMVEIPLSRVGSVVKTVNASVVDICNSSRRTELEMKGTQAALVVATLRGGLGEAATRVLRMCICRGLPVVLAVEVGTGAEEGGLAWEELPGDFRGHSEVLQLVRKMSSQLGYSLEGSGTISKVFAVRTGKLASTLNFERAAQEVRGAAAGCERFVSEVLSTLAAACLPCPLVHRADVYELLDRGLSEVIFTPASRRSRDDATSAILDKLADINTSLDDLLSVLASTEGAGDTFPAPEFSRDYLSSDERPHSEMPVDGALFGVAPNSPPGLNYLPVCWKQKTNIAIAHTVVNSLKMPVAALRQSYESSADFASDVLRGLQSCGWSISDHDCERFQNSAASHFEGGSYSWRNFLKVVVEKRIRACEEKYQLSALYLLFKANVFTSPPSVVADPSIDIVHPVPHGIMDSNERTPHKRSFSLLHSPASLFIAADETNNDKRLRSDDSSLQEQENRNFLNDESTFLSEVDAEQNLQLVIENALMDGVFMRPGSDQRRKGVGTGECDVNSLLSKCRNERQFRL